jgi:uncharacterized membrane protein (UPF0127 family)
VTPRPAVARLHSLPVETIQGREVPVAAGFRPRLLGLAGLRWEEAGPGLLIPRCAGVHTFGMRFALDVFFLDGRGEVMAIRRNVRPLRFVSCRGAAAVLEVPSAQGGEFRRLVD